MMDGKDHSQELWCP